MEQGSPNRLMKTPHNVKQKLIKGNEFIVQQWGVTQWVALSDQTLGMRVHARYLNGIVCINWSDRNDSYLLEFFTNTSFSGFLKNSVLKYMAEGLCFEQLLEFIDYALDKIPD